MEQSALLAETVEIIDPAHQFYGLTLPLLEITVKESVGQVCVVRLRPNVKRLIPLAATNLGGVFPPASPCRLSVAAARTAVGEKRWAATFAAGQALSLEQAIAEALSETDGG